MQLEENIDYSIEWLTTEILKQHKEDKNRVISIKKIDLLKVIIKFIKLNQRGE